LSELMRSRVDFGEFVGGVMKFVVSFVFGI